MSNTTPMRERTRRCVPSGAFGPKGLPNRRTFAGIKFHESQRGSNSCGFARAVCADETDDLAWRYGKVHVAQRETVANLALCIFDFQKGSP